MPTLTRRCSMGVFGVFLLDAKRAGRTHWQLGGPSYLCVGDVGRKSKPVSHGQDDRAIAMHSRVYAFCPRGSCVAHGVAASVGVQAVADRSVHELPRDQLAILRPFVRKDAFLGRKDLHHHVPHLAQRNAFHRDIFVRPSEELHDGALLTVVENCASRPWKLLELNELTLETLGFS
jgi:hypothetical protein